jgi:hypothetical protein
MRGGNWRDVKKLFLEGKKKKKEPNENRLRCKHTLWLIRTIGWRITWVRLLASYYEKNKMSKIW